jgi:hypothetical protein
MSASASSGEAPKRFSSALRSFFWSVPPSCSSWAQGLGLSAASGVQDLGFGVWSLGYDVRSFGFGVPVLGFGICGLGFGLWGFYG